jgi:hypothetical protein
MSTGKIAGLLENAGFAVELIPFRPRAGADRARIGEKPEGLPLGFTGHFNIVPLGAQPKSAFAMGEARLHPLALSPLDYINIGLGIL